MWLDKFLNTISHLFPSNPISGIEDVLGRLNPDKIYVENVRSLLGVSHKRALEILETAVRQGVFSRRIEVLCPNGRVAASAASKTQLPRTVTCWQEENGHYEEVEMPTEQLETLTYYKFNEREARGSYGQAT